MFLSCPSDRINSELFHILPYKVFDYSVPQRLERPSEGEGALGELSAAEGL